MGGAPVLDGCCSMGRCNNQLNDDGVGGGLGVGEKIRMGGTRGGGCFLIILGNKMWDEKNTNREGDGASDFDGFCWMGTKQPTKKQPYRWGILWRDGAQGGDDRGGRRRIFLAIRFWGK